jgi:hypothetical protein
MRPYDSSEALLRILNAPRRNHYFYGKRMDVQHFVMEQNYGKLKQWLLNRLTQGKGVICGLKVSVDGDRVCVDPGVAIDGLGREIVVPVRACIDPLSVDDGCCGRHGASVTAAAPPAGRPTDGIYTVWLCYHECLADHQPVLVSDCNTRDLCAAGAVVETFCLKATPGMPTLQGDPDWCAVLWRKEATPGNTGASQESFDAGALHEMIPAIVPAGGSSTTPNSSELSDANLAAIATAEKSRRHALCELFDKTCDPPDGDPCVPLALVILRDGKLTVEDCAVRPRIYSNAVLLDLILCLAEKIDECCGKHAAELMHVASIDFIARAGFVPEQVVASVQSPLQDTQVSGDKGSNALRIRFSMPFAQDRHVPKTHGPNDSDYMLRNVQILPVDPQKSLPYVPGALTIESPTTVRFDPTPDTPYAQANGAWTKGRYKIFLRGTEDVAKNQEALANTSGQALDGEPIAPAGGVMSGNGTVGGDFTTVFIVDAPAPRKTLRVQSIDFVHRAGENEQVVASVKTPREELTIQKPFTSIRMRFSVAFEQKGDHQPATAGPDEKDFLVHNVLVLSRDESTYMPGTISVEDATTFRFDATLPIKRTGSPANWPNGTYQLAVRGTDDAANKRWSLGEPDGTPLDGEPITPADGMMSGDGNPGGDFRMLFTVQIG